MYVGGTACSRSFTVHVRDQFAGAPHAAGMETGEACLRLPGQDPDVLAGLLKVPVRSAPARRNLPHCVALGIQYACKRLFDGPVRIRLGTHITILEVPDTTGHT